VDTDLDTLATALFVKTDDLLKSSPQIAPRRPRAGKTPQLSDAELVTLAMMQAILGFTCEARTAARSRRAAAAPASAAGPASAAAPYTVTATIPVGEEPLAVAVDPATHTAYVANAGFDQASVSVIDEATNTVTATIPVGSQPYAVGVDPWTRTVYVANSASHDVSVIDEASNTVTATIPVGAGPWLVAVDPAARTVYVANVDDDTVSVIDAATNIVTATIPLGGVEPWGLAVDPVTRSVYVADAAEDTVSVIDEETNTVTATISGVTPLGNPNTFNGLFLQQMAVDPTTGVVYVTDPSNDAVSMIDVTTNTVTGSIPVGSDPVAMAVDPTTHTAYVTNNGDGTVSVISAALPTPVTTVSSSRSPSTVGQRVTFTATVGPAGPGTVTFSSQSGTLCLAVPLSRVRHRTYRASCTTRALPPGRDKVVAAYSGDAAYGPSVGTVTQIVRRTRRRC
jgi:YVTN family beta-propeller protein